MLQATETASVSHTAEQGTTLACRPGMPMFARVRMRLRTLLANFEGAAVRAHLLTGEVMAATVRALVGAGVGDGVYAGVGDGVGDEVTAAGEPTALVPGRHCQ